MNRSLLALLVGTLMLMAAACGGASTGAPTPASTSVSSVAPVTTASSTAAATAAGAAAASTPFGSGTPVPLPATPTTVLPAGSVRLAIVADQSTASYAAREQLSTFSFPTDAIGKTGNVSGSIALDPKGAIVPDISKIAVDLTSLKSDQSMRDRFIQHSTLDTSTYPNAVFVPTAVQGLAAPVPTSGQASFKLLGNLTVHGVTKAVTWDVTATFSAQDVKGTATTTVTFEDFGMSPPKAGPVLSVQDSLKLSLDFVATRQSS